MKCSACLSTNTSIKMSEGKWLRQEIPFGTLRQHRCNECGAQFASIQVPMTMRMMEAVLDELPAQSSALLPESAA